VLVDVALGGGESAERTGGRLGARSARRTSDCGGQPCEFHGSTHDRGVVSAGALLSWTGIAVFELGRGLAAALGGIGRIGPRWNQRERPQDDSGTVAGWRRNHPLSRGDEDVGWETPTGPRGDWHDRLALKCARGAGPDLWNLRVVGAPSEMAQTTPDRRPIWASVAIRRPGGGSEGSDTGPREGNLPGGVRQNRRGDRTSGASVRRSSKRTRTETGRVGGNGWRVEGRERLPESGDRAFLRRHGMEGISNNEEGNGCTVTHPSNPAGLPERSRRWSPVIRGRHRRSLGHRMRTPQGCPRVAAGVRAGGMRAWVCWRSGGGDAVCPVEH